MSRRAPLTPAERREVLDDLAGRGPVNQVRLARKTGTCRQTAARDIADWARSNGILLRYSDRTKVYERVAP